MAHRNCRKRSRACRPVRHAFQPQIGPGKPDALLPYFLPFHQSFIRTLIWASNPRPPGV